MSHDKCKLFLEQGLVNDFSKDTTVVRLTKETTEERRKLDCYPWYTNSTPAAMGLKDLITEAGYKPYTSGWCDTCDPEDPGCEVTPYDNWGWCIPGCDGSLDEDPADFINRVHELPVDAYVYENCSKGVDTLSEFCTGFPITQGKMVEYRYKDNDTTFTKYRTYARQFHPGGIGWNGNDTIIRPGARYQGRQHSSYEGDACYGDAGGSVWKYWVFRNPGDSNAEGWSKNKRLAVLTGVISR